MSSADRWYRRIHPAVICFAYAGFIFFGGFWNWVFRAAIPTFVAASISAACMMVPGALSLGVSRSRRIGTAGVYLGMACAAIISGVYSWRAYLAYFEQSNVLKTALIGTQVMLGGVAFLLMGMNRHYGRPDR